MYNISYKSCDNFYLSKKVALWGNYQVYFIALVAAALPALYLLQHGHHGRLALLQEMDKQQCEGIG